MAVALFLFGLAVFLLSCAVIALELGLRLVLVLAWTVACLVGHRPLALLCKLLLLARFGSPQARIALRQLWIEARRRQDGLAC
jgi:hypothetical protein